MKLPPYNSFPNITGSKISLRQIIPADTEHLVEISFYDAVQATTVEEAAAMQAKINQDYMEGNSIHWGIADNATNKLAGTCGYYRGFTNGEGELGCVLLPQYRGKGYMTAAMQLAITFGINPMKLQRIRAITTQQNNKAIQLLNRLNFIKIADLQNDEIEYELRRL